MNTKNMKKHDHFRAFVDGMISERRPNLSDEKKNKLADEFSDKIESLWSKEKNIGRIKTKGVK